MSILGIIILGILVMLFLLAGRISTIARSLAPLLGMLQHIEGDALRLKETPKSISAMTRLELPRIERDFPEFHWPEWRQCSENILSMYLEAIEHRQVSYLKNVGPGIIDGVKLKIEENIEQDRQEKFDNTKIHQTEISRYEKDPFVCRVIVQLSVEYLHSLQGPHIEKPLSREKEQHRYELEIVYVQDVSSLGNTTMGLGVNCPNCGAPIANLGEKYCEYCGTAVEPINIRAWTPNKIQEI